MSRQSAYLSMYIIICSCIYKFVYVLIISSLKDKNMKGMLQFTKIIIVIFYRAITACILPSAVTRSGCGARGGRAAG